MDRVNLSHWIQHIVDLDSDLDSDQAINTISPTTTVIPITVSLTVMAIHIMAIKDTGLATVIIKVNSFGKIHSTQIFSNEFYKFFLFYFSLSNFL